MSNEGDEMKKDKVSCSPYLMEEEEWELHPKYKKLLFEAFDEYMDERDKLKQKMHKVEITGSEKNKDKAWEAIEICGEGFHCLENEGYIINGLQKKALDRAKIKYEVKKR